MVVCDGVARADRWVVIAGFFTGGALAIRGGYKAARNSAIGCACLLAVIEGVGIGFQRMMAENTRLEVWPSIVPFRLFTDLFPRYHNLLLHHHRKPAALVSQHLRTE